MFAWYWVIGAFILGAWWHSRCVRHDLHAYAQRIIEEREQSYVRSFYNTIRPAQRNLYDGRFH